MITKNNHHTVDNWNDLKQRLAVGQKVGGVVIGTERFGVFVDIGEAFNGLLLVPFMQKKPVQSIDEYPKIGDRIGGGIINFAEHELDNNKSAI